MHAPRALTPGAHPSTPPHFTPPHPTRRYALLEKKETADFLSSLPWQAVVLDEAHGLKNAGSLRFAHAMALPARSRLLLTGTPVQNNVEELVTLLRWVAAAVAAVVVMVEARGREPSLPPCSGRATARLSSPSTPPSTHPPQVCGA